MRNPSLRLKAVPIGPDEVAQIVLVRSSSCLISDVLSYNRCMYDWNVLGRKKKIDGWWKIVVV